MVDKIDKENIEYCFCTLSLGPRYIDITNAFLESYLKNIPSTGPNIVVVSDHPDRLVKGEKIIPVLVDKEIIDFIGHTRRFITLKWLAFEAAFKLGYRNNICFIDVDSTVSENWSDEFLDEIESGMGCNWYITYKGDINSWRKKRGRASEKLALLMRDSDKLPITCPVECIMFLRETEERMKRFISEWKNIWKEITEKKLYERQVCHEIGLAALRTGIRVYKYKSGKRAFFNKSFKHYGYSKAKRLLKN